MSAITNSVANAAGYQSASEVKQKSEVTKKTKVSGKTVGNPTLSEKAAKYYEELKKKYSNMDFILVSRDKKQEVEAQAAKYAGKSSSELVVLIDEDKIERMAEDEAYRKQYEGIIANAASGLSRMKDQLQASGANVRGYGIKVNDNGTASYFAVLEKSSAAQRERIEKKAEEKREAKKAEDKKARREEWEERIQGDTVTVTANSLEELLSKIESFVYSDVQTEEEKQVGQNFDFSI